MIREEDLIQACIEAVQNFDTMIDSTEELREGKADRASGISNVGSQRNPAPGGSTVQG